MKFTKMHCAGNDYVIIDCFNEIFETPDIAAEFLCDRHFGIGSDALVLVLNSALADYKIKIYNPDGSEAETSGNGLCCVGKYLYDSKYVEKESTEIETMSGIKKLYINDDAVTVNMGEPVFTPQLIPVDYTGDEFINRVISVDNEEYQVTCLSVGNPHTVIFSDDIYTVDMESIGRKIELHQIFPKRTNVEFVKIIDRSTLEMRVWSRGNGETLSSGTGACAAVVSAVQNGTCNSSAKVVNIGGDIEIEWKQDDNCVYMTATAKKVFDGEIELK